MSHHRKSTIGGLTVTRKEGTKIFVNHGEIVIEVVEIQGKYVKLSFLADREILITRDEPEMVAGSSGQKKEPSAK